MRIIIFHDVDLFATKRVFHLINHEHCMNPTVGACLFMCVSAGFVLFDCLVQAIFSL